MSTNFQEGKFCLYCQRLTLSCYELFDEIGLELQLPMLLESLLGLRIETQQRAAAESVILCEECVNHLIELYDLVEHERQQQLLEQQQLPEEKAKTVENLDLELNVADDVMVFELTEGVTQSHCYEEFEDGDEESSSESIESVLSQEEVYHPGVVDDDEVFIYELDHDDTEVHQNFNEHLNETFDIIDLNTYLDKVINSKLEDLNFKWANDCRLCGVQTDSFQSLLTHLDSKHNRVCVLNDCNQALPSTKLLARHVLLKHYDVDKLKLFFWCPHCKRRFSSLSVLNKHSCCRKITHNGRITIGNGRITICRMCNSEFYSNKRYAFHMQFHLSDRRPKICLICESVFSDTDEFFEHVHYSHETTNVNVCNICDRGYKDKQLLEAHQNAHYSKCRYSCSFCSKKYFYKFMLNQHMSICQKESSQKPTCSECSKQFINNQQLQKHQKIHAGPALVNSCYCSNCGLISREGADILVHIRSKNSVCTSANILQEILQDAYVCEFCSKDFRSIADLKRHRASGVHDDDKYTCPICEKEFTEAKNLRNHKKSHQDHAKWLASFPLRRMFVCNFENCHASFVRWSDVSVHRHRSHKALICDTCQQSFKTKDDLKLHKISCQEKSDYICQFCHKQCSSKMSLSVHIARSHNSNNHICPHCKSIFTSSQALENHIDFMHVKMHCELCDKTMKNKRNMNTHMQVVHLNIQRYFCKICKKGFYHRSEMDAHERTVHSSIVYKCDKCLFTTNYAKSLDIHQAMHEQNLPFKCIVCERGFGRKHVLEMHLRRHKKNREFICRERFVDGCEASFVSNHLRSKHIKEKHFNETAACKRSKKNQFHPTTLQNNDEDETVNIYDVDDHSNSNVSSTSVTLLNLEEDILDSGSVND